MQRPAPRSAWTWSTPFRWLVFSHVTPLVDAANAQESLEEHAAEQLLPGLEPYEASLLASRFDGTRTMLVAWGDTQGSHAASSSGTRACRTRNSSNRDTTAMADGSTVSGAKTGKDSTSRREGCRTSGAKTGNATRGGARGFAQWLWAARRSRDNAVLRTLLYLYWRRIVLQVGVGVWGRGNRQCALQSWGTPRGRNRALQGRCGPLSYYICFEQL